VSPVGVALAYAPWLNVLVIDRQDQRFAPALLQHGVSPLLADILLTDRQREIALARRVLNSVGA
jgi:hypothetical protein